jgi:hypothetical protein
VKHNFMFLEHSRLMNISLLPGFPFNLPDSLLWDGSCSSVYLFLAGFLHIWHAGFSAYVVDIWSLVLVDFCLHIFCFLTTT